MSLPIHPRSQAKSHVDGRSTRPLKHVGDGSGGPAVQTSCQVERAIDTRRRCDGVRAAEFHRLDRRIGGPVSPCQDELLGGTLVEKAQQNLLGQQVGPALNEILDRGPPRCANTNTGWSDAKRYHAVPYGFGLEV